MSMLASHFKRIGTSGAIFGTLAFAITGAGFIVVIARFDPAAETALSSLPSAELAHFPAWLVPRGTLPAPGMDGVINTLGLFLKHPFGMFAWAGVLFFVEGIVLSLATGLSLFPGLFRVLGIAACLSAASACTSSPDGWIGAQIAAAAKDSAGIIGVLGIIAAFAFLGFYLKSLVFAVFHATARMKANNDIYFGPTASHKVKAVGTGEADEHDGAVVTVSGGEAPLRSAAPLPPVLAPAIPPPPGWRVVVGFGAPPPPPGSQVICEKTNPIGFVCEGIPKQPHLPLTDDDIDGAWSGNEDGAAADFKLKILPANKKPPEAP